MPEKPSGCLCLALSADKPVQQSSGFSDSTRLWKKFAQKPRGFVEPAAGRFNVYVRPFSYSASESALAGLSHPSNVQLTMISEQESASVE